MENTEHINKNNEATEGLILACIFPGFNSGILANSNMGNHILLSLIPPAVSDGCRCSFPLLSGKRSPTMKLFQTGKCYNWNKRKLQAAKISSCINTVPINVVSKSLQGYLL
ncbi:unnamed protein product [Lepidochelys kempii]